MCKSEVVVLRSLIEDSAPRVGSSVPRKMFICTYVDPSSVLAGRLRLSVRRRGVLGYLRRVARWVVPMVVGKVTPALRQGAGYLGRHEPASSSFERCVLSWRARPKQLVWPRKPRSYVRFWPGETTSHRLQATTTRCPRQDCPRECKK